MHQSYLIDRYYLRMYCSTCQANQTINQTFQAPSYEYFEVDDWIESQAVINTNTKISFEGGTFINLLPGFVAQKGASFSAYIYGCNGSISNKTHDKPRRFINNTQPDLHQSFPLIQNIPNPFSNHTTFDIQLAEATEVNLEIYDVTGKLITVILDNQTLESGQHKINFDANNLSSGIYLYRLATKQENITKKMVLKK